MEPTKPEPSDVSEHALRSTEIDVLPTNAAAATSSSRKYRYRYTTGPFSLPANAGSLDWIVLNNEATTQQVRITVFRCGLATPKIALPPGPLELTINPDETTHNANTYPIGFVYEIQVETNSQHVFPYTAVWPGNFGETIAGTAIPAASFVRHMA